MPQPQFAKRAHKRESLLVATDKVDSAVAAARLKGRDNIGVRVGKVINQYKMAEHFELDITDRSRLQPQKRQGQRRSRA